MSKAKESIGLLQEDRKVLWIAIASGILAVIFLYIYLQGKKAPYGQMVPVVVASADLNKGEAFTEKTVEVALRPEAFVAPGVVSPEDMNYIFGKAATVPVARGQQVLWSYVQSESSIEALSEALNAEYHERAVTITVDEVKGVAGHIRRNDRVDVIGTFTVPARSPNGPPVTKTKTLLQCVTIFAVGARGAGDGGFGFQGMPTSVTLKVTPEEAALLTFAESVGQLRLVLRNPDDLDIATEPREFQFSNLFKQPTISRARRKSLRIIYGLDKNQIQ